MKPLLQWLLVFMLFSACSTEPQPLVMGKDVCHLCKMTLVDARFGAELVTRHGKVYKFDDVRCFLDYYHSGYENPEDFVHRLVVDYQTPGKLIPAMDAFYLKSEQFTSPMSSGIAAFETEGAMNDFRKRGGIFMAWGEIQTQFK